MGDDERFDYIYKFVSEANYKSMLARGRSPLDHGTLYVARFNDDGTGDWLELSLNNPAVAAVFSSMDEVVTYARVAADAAGATPMDRPEWTTVAPNGDVYCTLTNNSRRGPDQVDAANPQGPNLWGHIIRWRDADHHVGTTFEWDIFVLASETLDTDYGFGSPDGIWADPYGRLFIETDGSQPGGNNDQMLVADTGTGEIRRMWTGVAGCEITGIAVTPDQKTMFINVQHPGNIQEPSNGDPLLTLFPFYEGPVPRDCTVVITRKDGGIVGS
jgi:secreted PhoX family phosphatase